MMWIDEKTRRAAEIEDERQERRLALEYEAEYRDAESTRMRRLEDRVKDLEDKVKELYEEKMSRLHGGY